VPRVGDERHLVLELRRAPPREADPRAGELAVTAELDLLAFAFYAKATQQLAFAGRQSFAGPQCFAGPQYQEQRIRAELLRGPLQFAALQLAFDPEPQLAAAIGVEPEPSGVAELQAQVPLAPAAHDGLGAGLSLARIDLGAPGTDQERALKAGDFWRRGARGAGARPGSGSGLGARLRRQLSRRSGGRRSGGRRSGGRRSGGRLTRLRRRAAGREHAAPGEEPGKEKKRLQRGSRVHRQDRVPSRRIEPARSRRRSPRAPGSG
jgi:hypothetical protein